MFVSRLSLATHPERTPREVSILLSILREASTDPSSALRQSATSALRKPRRDNRGAPIGGIADQSTRRNQEFPSDMQEMRSLATLHGSPAFAGCTAEAPFSIHPDFHGCGMTGKRLFGGRRDATRRPRSEPPALSVTGGS
jgi:hypothetical protein